MNNSYFSILLVLALGFVCLLGIHSNAKAGNIAVGGFTGVSKSNGATPLTDGSIVQCLYAGSDGTIAMPNADGPPGGGDEDDNDNEENG